MARAGTRMIPAPSPTILPATDLGRVEIAKHGNLYLLTDGQGDILNDGRGLGLYDLDTRILSTSILRLNGERLTLLRGPHASDGADTIQLTNPEPRRGPHEKQAVALSLSRRDLRVSRARRIDGGLEERLTIVNYSATAQPIDIELAIGVDMADIFEVRGYNRASRGALRPIELDGDRALFAYDGLDDVRRSTTVCAEAGGRVGPIADPDAFPGATVQLSWDGILAPGARMTVGWRVEKLAAESLTSGEPLPEMGVTTAATAHDAHSPAAEPNPPPASPAEPRPIPTISTDNRLFD